MLNVSRKQMATIGQAQLQANIVEFLRRHFPDRIDALPASELDAHIAALIAQCRKRGLTSQRAVAGYALAAFVCGSDTVASDPALTQALADRRTPQDERARLIEIWLASTWNEYQQQSENA